jgi:hypothetical protein
MWIVWAWPLAAVVTAGGWAWLRHHGWDGITGGDEPEKLR